MVGWTLTHHFFVLLFTICSRRWIAVDASRDSRVSITDYGYNNLVVAISSKTAVSQSETIIDNVKKMIADASPVLYTATGDRAYFQSVHILIPAKWEHVEADPSTWETFDTADVIVDTPNPIHGDVPYTQHNGKCAEQGERIHLTPDYVATLLEKDNILQYGEPGKVFVHEWAHYRYGIFDEYGTAGGIKYPLFYRQQNSATIEPNICANNPTMFTVWDVSNNAITCKTDPVTKIYDENCRFKLDKYFEPETSLASYHQIKSVVHFCKDDQVYAHRTDAPNEHNAKCNGASTWTIIMKSPDFADIKKGKSEFKNLPPEFRIVRATVSRFVVVMDVSGSMKEFNRIGKLGESVRAWIKTDFPGDNKLGMVKFSSTAEIVSELQMISDIESREEMMAKVPKDTSVATCIGCGLELAIQMLKEGGIILLVTDGKNSPGYLDISDVKTDIERAKIRVIAIAVGNEADKNIENLADETGGKSYFIRDDDSSEALQQAFVGSFTYQSSSVQNEDLTFKLFEKDVLASAAQTDLVDEFDVDSTVGRNLKLRVFDLVNKKSVKSIELTGPDGDVVNNFVFDTSTATLTVDLAEIGRWSLKVSLKSTQSKKVLVTVTTQMRPDAKAPITTKCLIPNGSDVRDANEKEILIQAKVEKGNHPVTGASVKAYVVKPNDETEILDLLDNGADPDATQDDGVYSRYFAYPNQQGRYTVKCQVNSNRNSFEKLGFIGSASPQLFDPQDDETSIGDIERIPMADFTRIVSGGSFQVEIPVSSNDSYPPSKVTDLSVTVVNDTATNVSIALKWTAPGDDLDAGTASYYELKYSDVVADVLNSNFGNESSIRGSRSVITEDDLVAGSLQPKEAGSLQMATFQLADVQREKPHYLSLRAVDKAEKVGQVSNFVVFFVPEKSALPITTTNTDDGSVEANTEEDSSGEATDHEVPIHINIEEPKFRSSSVLLVGFGLILTVCLCVALLMAVIKHTQVYRYDGIPA